MSVPVALLLFAGGFALTVASSVVLARELDRIGERLGFSEALLGIITALGADAPEIASAVAAIVAGHEDTGVGVVVGSNVFNIAGLLGVSALIAGPVRIHTHGLALTGGVAVAVAVIGGLVAVDVLPGVVGLLRERGCPRSSRRPSRRNNRTRGETSLRRPRPPSTHLRSSRRWPLSSAVPTAWSRRRSRSATGGTSPTSSSARWSSRL
jgi:hypothetical protein